MWEKVETNGRSIPQVVIRKNVIAFSAYFLKNEKLIEENYVEILFDRHKKRIGFVFSKNPKTGSLALKQDGGKLNQRSGCGRIVYINLCKERWIKETLEIEGKRRSQSLNLDKMKYENNTLYYCELQEHFSNRKEIIKIDAIDIISGVYRLYNIRTEIVRIGESQDIKKRIKDHLRENPSKELEFFDFLIIEETKERKAKEKKLLNNFKKEHNGYLPRLNSITA